MKFRTREIGGVINMAEHRSAGHPLLNASAYEALGRSHSQVFDEMRSRDPDLRGAELAAHALALISPDLAAVIAPGGGADLREWVVRKGGTLPAGLSASWTGHGRIGGLLPEVSAEGDPVQWLGLAVVVALVGGITLPFGVPRLRTPAVELRSPRSQRPPDSRPSTGVDLTIALGTDGGKVRMVGVDPSRAGDLLTRATYWWTGAPAAWRELSTNLSLRPISAPNHDDDFVVVVYSVTPAPSSGPTSRPEAAMLLQDLARSGRLAEPELYDVPVASELPANGFRR